MALPSVTVAMALYNDEQFVGEAIRSVLAQTHQDFELLIVDDGSTDGSLDVVRSFDDPRIRLISDGRNFGQATRHNQATDLARGEFVARLDSDDLMVADRLALQTSYLLENLDRAFVSTAAYQMTSDGRLLGLLESGRDALTVDRLLWGGGGIAHGTSLFRKEWLGRHRYREDLRRNEDADLWLRAFLAGDLRAGFMDEPLTLVRLDERLRRDKLVTGFKADRAMVQAFDIPPLSRMKALARSWTKEALVRTLPEPILRVWLYRRRVHTQPTLAMQRDFKSKMSAAGIGLP